MRIITPYTIVKNVKLCQRLENTAYNAFEHLKQNPPPIHLHLVLNWDWVPGKVYFDGTLESLRIIEMHQFHLSTVLRPKNVVYSRYMA